MRISLSLFLFFLLFIQIIQSSAVLFSDNQEDSDAFLWLEQFAKDGNKIEKSFMSIAIQKGWWKTAEEIVTISKEQNIDISSSFYRSQSIIKSHLQKIHFMLGKTEDWANISPAFQWAQGQRTISLNIKYAHKWDTPATLGCVLHNITYTPDEMQLESRCNSTHKRFLLTIPTYKQLIPDECKLTDSSVGRVVVSLRKAEPGFWSDLYKDHKKAPRNMHTWWSMKDQLNKEDEEIKKEEDRKKKEEEEKQKLEKEKQEKQEKDKKWLKEEDQNKTIHVNTTETAPASTETPSAHTETAPTSTETPSAPTETAPISTETPSAHTETPSAPTETPSAHTETDKTETEKDTVSSINNNDSVEL